LSNYIEERQKKHWGYGQS